MRSHAGPISTFMCLRAIYFPTIDLPILLQEICGPIDPGSTLISHRHMNVEEIGTEAAQFPEKECINGIFVAMQPARLCTVHTVHSLG
jgi:hypothetical protein